MTFFLYSEKYFQFLSNRGEGELNSQKRDKFYLVVNGLQRVDFGSKSMDECLQRFQFGFKGLININKVLFLISIEPVTARDFKSLGD